MSSHRTLLATPGDAVAPALIETVVAFCEPLVEISAAYVGLVETTGAPGGGSRQLAVAFELLHPATESEGNRELHHVADRFYDVMPAEVLAGGCNFLEPAALAVWQAKARRVYPPMPAVSP